MLLHARTCNVSEISNFFPYKQNSSEAYGDQQVREILGYCHFLWRVKRPKSSG